MDFTGILARLHDLAEIVEIISVPRHGGKPGSHAGTLSIHNVEKLIQLFSMEN